jgi:tetratricopeptide (TPR) repeat protein
MHKSLSVILCICQLSFGLLPVLADNGSIQNKVSTVESSNTDEAGRLAASAQILSSQGQFADAEPQFKKALSMWDEKAPKNLVEKAGCLGNLALLYATQGKFEQAIPLYKEALLIEEAPDVVKSGNKSLPTLHAITLDNLAQAHRLSGQLDAAEPLYRQALTIEEQILAPDDFDMAITRNNLSLLYIKQKNYKAAEELILKSLPVLRGRLGVDNADYLKCVGYYCDLLHNTNRDEKAAEVRKDSGASI